MNITSLLQEAPSVDRTRRNKPQQPWEENANSLGGSSSRPATATGTSNMTAGAAQVPVDEGLTGGIGRQSQSYQVMKEYIDPSQRERDSVLYGQQATTTATTNKQLEQEKDGYWSKRVGDYPLYDPGGSIYSKDYSRAPDLERDHHSLSRPGGRVVVVDMDIANRYEPSAHHSPSTKPPIVSANVPLNAPVPVPATATGPTATISTTTITTTAAAVPAALLPPPPTPSPSLPPAHLGTFVYPNLPFPISPSSLPYNRRTTLTVLVPSTHLPRPLSSSTSSSSSSASSLSGLTLDQRARNIWGGIPLIDERKIYTDDSDIVFAAFHSGVLTYDEKLWTRERDLKLELRVYPVSDYGRFFGGLGANGLTSASWGNSHEGCAFTILSAKWVPSHTALSYTRQTRKARMAEYAQRRAAIMNGSSPSSSSSSSSTSSSTLQQRRNSENDDDMPSSVLDTFKPPQTIPQVVLVDPIEQEITSLTLSGGWQSPVGFKYKPMGLYLILFAFNPNVKALENDGQAESENGGPPAKRRKVESTKTKTKPPGAPDKEIILRKTGTANERIVLVPIVRPIAVMEESQAMQVDDQAPSSSSATEQEQEVVYDMFRETLVPRVSISEGLRDPSSTINILDSDPKPKGVRFAASKADEEEEEQWKRELIHSTLGMQDFTFDVSGIVVKAVVYDVDEWTWKSTVPGRDLKGGVVNRKKLGQKKKKRRGVKKIKTKINAKAAEGLQDVVVPTGDQGSKEEASMEAESSEATAKDTVVDSSKQDASTSKDDKEEGELSG